MADLNVLKNHLYTEYEIGFGRRIRKKILDGSIEKDKLIAYLTLRNLFLLRRLADPGFDAFVNKAVLADSRTLGESRDVIRSLVRRGGEGIEFEFEGLDALTPTIAPRPVAMPPINLYDPATLRKHWSVSALKEELKADLEYLRQRKQEAINANNVDEIVSIDWSLSEFKNLRTNFYLLFSSADFFKGQSYSMNWSLKSKALVQNRIKMGDLYGANPLHHFVPGMCSVDVRTDLEDYFIDFLTEFGYNIRGRPEELVEWSKYIGNAISIAEQLWFNKQTETRKIEILNTLYPVEVVPQPERYDSQEDFYLFTVYMASYLGQIGLYDESIAYCRYLLECPINQDIKYSCYDNMGAAQRELGNYQEALDSFKMALEVAESICPQYTVAVELKNYGEALLAMGQASEAKDVFNRLDVLLPRLSKEDTGKMLWNLACVHRRQYDFKKEMRYLVRILGATGYNEKTYQHAQARMDVLNSPAFIREDCSMDEHRLRFFEKVQSLKECLKRAEENLLSFNFEGHRRWLSRALALEDNPAYRYGMIRSHYLEGGYEKMEALLSDVPRVYPYYQWAVCLCAVSKYARGMVERGYELVEPLLIEDIRSRYEHDFLLAFFIKELAHNGLQELFDPLLDKLLGNLDDPEDKVILMFAAAQSFQDIALYEQSKQYYIKAMQHAQTDVQRGRILGWMGVLNQAWGYEEQAVNAFKGALEILPDQANSYYGLSVYHARKGDYKNALENIGKAIDLNPNNHQLIKERNMYIDLSKEVLNIKSVQSNEALNSLEMAEQLLLNPVLNLGKDAKSDYSLAILSYGKAAETMLHEVITCALREPILAEFGGRIPKEYWKGERGVKPLPKGLKSMLGEEGTTVSFGEWIGLMEGVEVNKNNPVTCEFDSRMSAMFAKDQVGELVSICKALKPFRDSAAHYQSLSRDEALSKRKYIVSNINKLTTILYDQHNKEGARECAR